ncbi:heterokaryon incompatibility protein-domain-containing protein [Podospora aff. communis PSN243]|uniref:Heterokaryon incompatibility protein-domain-containing protein n=1 Tax=Podospora aff. communis PSN243 TaxID=3040156 RepID=A0AAV9GQC4_9PEZI|nr:heterokaryon incompatibility protein-domain-containing protein [Podospora aff. communis PSN243]
MPQEYWESDARDDSWGRRPLPVSGDYRYAQTLAIGSNVANFSMPLGAYGGYGGSARSEMHWFTPTNFNRDMAEILAKDHDFELRFNTRTDFRHESLGTIRPLVLPQGSTNVGLLYSPLPSNEDFRLLEILPGTVETKILCRLHVCAMADNCGAYDALSYTWDLGLEYDIGLIKTKAPGPIECNGIEMEVGANLYHALRRMRREHSPRILWVDAICINQDDIQERSQQVAAMGHIFRNAHSVLVWLGLGLAPNRNRSPEITPPPEEAFAGICAVVSTWAAARGHVDLVEQPRYFGSHRNRSAGGVHGSASVHEDSIIWPEILKMYGMRWFSRLWVLQEVALARQATVIWGDFEIPWQWVGLAAAIIRNNWDKIAPSTYQQTRRDGERPERAVPSGVMNAYFMYRISNTQTYFEPLRFSFCELLTLTRQFQCQSKHDKLFGLLGLPTTDGINSMITPDYTKPLQAIYHDLAYAMTSSTRPLDFLSHVHHPLTIWNKAFGSVVPPEDQDIPSWVPIWHIRGPKTRL